MYQENPDLRGYVRQNGHRRQNGTEADRSHIVGGSGRNGHNAHNAHMGASPAKGRMSRHNGRFSHNGLFLRKWYMEYKLA